MKDFSPNQLLNARLQGPNKIITIGADKISPLACCQSKSQNYGRI
jgi:hypothetical protein